MALYAVQYQVQLHKATHKASHQVCSTTALHLSQGDQPTTTLQHLLLQVVLPVLSLSTTKERASSQLPKCKKYKKKMKISFPIPHSKYQSTMRRHNNSIPAIKERDQTKEIPQMITNRDGKEAEMKERNRMTQKICPLSSGMLS